MKILICFFMAETMEDWDQETLEKVVASKGAEYQQNKPTDIVCPTQHIACDPIILSHPHCVNVWHVIFQLVMNELKVLVFCFFFVNICARQCFTASMFAFASCVVSSNA